MFLLYIVTNHYYLHMCNFDW